MCSFCFAFVCFQYCLCIFFFFSFYQKFWWIKMYIYINSSLQSTSCSKLVGVWGSAVGRQCETIWDNGTDDSYWVPCPALTFSVLLCRSQIAYCVNRPTCTCILFATYSHANSNNSNYSYIRLYNAMIIYKYNNTFLIKKNTHVWLV